MVPDSGPALTHRRSHPISEPNVRTIAVPESAPPPAGINALEQRGGVSVHLAKQGRSAGLRATGSRPSEMPLEFESAWYGPRS